MLYFTVYHESISNRNARRFKMFRNFCIDYLYIFIAADDRTAYTHIPYTHAFTVIAFY